jgi:hypothetical protein
MSFSIHDVKNVDERWDPDEVNDLLTDGWFLLSVGFEINENGSEKVYILGRKEF